MKESKDLTNRNKLYIREYFEALKENPESVTGAIVTAYSKIYPKKYRDQTKLKNSAKALHYNVMHKPGVAKLLDAAFPNDELVATLADIARNAKKDNVFQGEIISSSPDNTAKLSALSQISNIKGNFQKQRNIEINMEDKRQTLIVYMDESKMNQPDRPVKDIEAEFITEYEKNMEE